MKKRSLLYFLLIVLCPAVVFAGQITSPSTPQLIFVLLLLLVYYFLPIFAAFCFIRAILYVVDVYKCKKRNQIKQQHACKLSAIMFLVMAIVALIVYAIIYFCIFKI